MKHNFFRVKERIYKTVYVLSDRVKRLISLMNRIAGPVFFVLSVLFVSLCVFHIGFFRDGLYQIDMQLWYKILLLLLFVSKLFLFAGQKTRKKTFPVFFELALISYGFITFFYVALPSLHLKGGYPFFTGTPSMITLSALYVLSETHKLISGINSFNIAPGLLFAFSFLLLIVMGTFLLLLPNSHTGKISFPDAFFTSASAVCVTGLIVVDTSSAFTTTGQIILLALIQLGGLGIMTFTGFLSYIFTGGATFRERLMLKDIVSSENIGNLFKVVIKIILVVFIIELAGALLIYIKSPVYLPDRMFFAVFHSVSAFCNAGFSTLPEGLNTVVVRQNYALHMLVAFLIILGGIGFPVLLALYQRIKHTARFYAAAWKRRNYPVARHKDVSTYIVVLTTFILIAAGMALYLLFENKTTLYGLSGIQKAMVAFFGSVSARTAGFNVTNITLWHSSTLFLMMFLMWIGASPGSTGGGIKTTTFAIALVTAGNFIRGNENIEIRRRQIGKGTLVRVVSIIILSLIFIFCGFMGLVILEPDKNPVYLLFESFSAFGTVGLSVVNTATLGEPAKWIIVFLMFTGRIGPLTLLSGVFMSSRKKYYNYPQEELIIN